jgi:signal transduction histidine kinase
MIAFCCEVCFADSTIVFSNEKQKVEIGEFTYILEDQTNKLKIEDVVNSNNFKKSTAKVPNIGVTKFNIWVRFSIKNTTSKPILLELAYPIIDRVELYTQDSGYSFKEQFMGEYLPFSRRSINHPNYIFELESTDSKSHTYYLKVKSGEQILLPLTIASSNVIFESLKIKDLLFGIYFGIILVMSIYNFFIYITIRDKIYLYYVIYTILVGLTQTTLQGYTFQYLWPNNYWLVTQSTYLFPGLVGFALISFLRVSLQTKQHTPLFDKGLNIFIGIYILCIVLAFLKIYEVSYTLIQLNGLLTAMYLIFIAIKVQKDNKSAKFFLIGFSSFLVGVCIFALKDFGILPYNNFTNYTMQAGTAIEVILFSFALADRINTFKKEKEDSQQQAILALEENRRLITEQNVFLERKVEERTSALTKSNHELSTTLRELKQTQSQLVNSEKMASLGQLTAGIAHEINNPINFVVSNVKPLRRDIEDIHELVKKYADASDSSDMKEEIAEINNFKKEIDYEYIKEEISNLLNGIEEGALRTAEIVKGLRVFSRLDENDLKKTNLVEGIESTFTLLNSEIGEINLVKNYSTIPEVECYPGKMNQVFMNIINNAIFAIKANNTRVSKGELIISTTADNEHVKIAIKDNGVGMSEEVKAKIFEPFFTTKDVGKGTGLGMSITYTIIEGLKGEIEVKSEFGKGTEFIITLPISQSTKNT